MTRAELVRWIADPFERAASTAVQVFLTAVVAGGVVADLTSVPWLGALAAAGYASLASLLMSAVTAKVPPLPHGWDLLWRVVKTFAQSVSGLFLVQAGQVVGFSMPWQQVLLTSAGAALAALVKGWIASGAAGTAPGASLLPATATADGVHVITEVTGPDVEPDHVFDGPHDDPGDVDLDADPDQVFDGPDDDQPVTVADVGRAARHASDSPAAAVAAGTSSEGS